MNFIFRYLILFIDVDVIWKFAKSRIIMIKLRGKNRILDGKKFL